MTPEQQKQLSETLQGRANEISRCFKAFTISMMLLNKRLSKNSKATLKKMEKINFQIPQFQCTLCGQVGSVGMCCGTNTREPLNAAARLALRKRVKSELKDNLPILKRSADLILDLIKIRLRISISKGK